MSISKVIPEDLLKDHELKVTSQRVTVLKAFITKNKVLSLAELHKMLGKEFDRITLYRTLNSFEDHGLIHKIPDTTGNSMYALCKHDSVHHTHEDNHVHFKCSSCNTTLCLEEVAIPTIKIPKKYKPEKFSFLVEGYCEKCNKK